MISENVAPPAIILIHIGIDLTEDLAILNIIGGVLGGASPACAPFPRYFDIPDEANLFGRGQDTNAIGVLIFYGVAATVGEAIIARAQCPVDLYGEASPGEIGDAIL
jgi:hypothetical protein